MRKKLFALMIAGAAVVGGIALASGVKGGKVCPSGMKTVQCPYGIICCDPPAGQNPNCSCF